MSLTNGRFEPGHKTWNKGILRTDEEKKKMSEAIKEGYKNGRKPNRYWLGKKMPDHVLKVLSENRNNFRHTEEHKESIRGKNSKWWKGGISKFSKLIRYCQKAKEWREEIFERDNHTCKKCNKRGGDLEAHHHPIEFKELVKKFLSQNENKQDFKMAMEFREFWDTTNGITLCKSCHKKFHYSH